MTDLVESDSARLVFRDAPPSLTVSELRATLDGINNAYEFLAIVSLPGYEAYPLSDRVSPRVHSRLARPDELRVTTLAFGSPLDLLMDGVPSTLWLLGAYLGGLGEGDPFGGPVAMRLGVGGSWSTVERTRLG